MPTIAEIENGQKITFQRYIAFSTIANIII